MKEKYEKIKNEYLEYVVFIKSGKFYITFNKDAYIVGGIFNYKIINSKVGFPINSLAKVINKLENMKINYIVDNDEKKNFKNLNNYNDCYKRCCELQEKRKNIENIVKCLNKSINSDEFNIIIKKINGIINE